MKVTNHILITSFIFCLSLCLSCKKDKAEIDFRDPTLAECLLNKILADNDTLTLIYNEGYQVVKLEKNPLEYKLITYDAEGKINQIDEYYPNDERYYTTFTMINYQLEAIYYEFSQGEWLDRYKKIYEYNENYEVTKITDYSKDASNATWILDGDYYLYQWENGNITKAENWDNYSSSGNVKQQSVFKKKQTGLLTSAKEVYKQRGRIKSESDDYNLFSTTLFEYDSKINPLRYLTIGNIFSPDEFNYSKNNWTKKTYTNILNKITSEVCNYSFNDKNFPIMKNIQMTQFFADDTISTNSQEYYEYTCK